MANPSPVICFCYSMLTRYAAAPGRKRISRNMNVAHFYYGWLLIISPVMLLLCASLDLRGNFLLSVRNRRPLSHNSLLMSVLFKLGTRTPPDAMVHSSPLSSYRTAMTHTQKRSGPNMRRVEPWRCLCIPMPAMYSYGVERQSQPSYYPVCSRQLDG